MKQTNASGFKPSVTVTSHRTAMGRLLLMTLLLFAIVGGTRAQQALPYTYGFEDNDLAADGWTTENTSTKNANDFGITTAAKNNGNYGFQFSSYTKDSSYDQYLISPELSAATGVLVQFYYRASSGYGTETFKVGYSTTDTDIASFTFGDEISTSSTTWTLSEEFNFPAGTKYVAIHYYSEYQYRLYIDDFTFDAPSSCAKPSNIVATPNLQSLTLTWTGDAGSYDVAYSTDSNANPEDVIVSTVNTTSYSKDGLALGDYFFWLRSNCSSTEHSAWAGPISVHIGYCQPSPATRDGLGITGVSFGIGTDVVNNSNENGLPASKPFYGDYSSMVGAVYAGVESPFAITTATGSYPYGIVIWVDLDNSLTFTEDEIVYMGQCSEGNGTLEAPITIPATQATGNYRMRIGGADDAFDGYINGSSTTAPNPCYTGSYAVFHDYTLRVLDAPSCLPPSGLAVSYTSDDTAELSWTGDAASYDIDVNGTIIENVTGNTYTLTKLTLGTVYEVKMRANCSATEHSIWTNAVSFKTNDCMDADMCYITYELKANAYQGSYSYGWYYSSLLVYDADTDELVDEWTVPSGDEDGIVTGAIAVCPAKKLRFEWYCSVSSSNDELLVGNIVVKDANGEDIINTTGALTTNVNYTVDCTISEFKKPTNLTASEIGPNSAVLSWTENGTATAWVIDVYNNDDDEEEFVNASTNPFTLTGLNAETEYFVRVRPAGENTKWSDGIFVNTVYADPADLAASNITATSADITWTANADVASITLEYVEGIVGSHWYQYDNGTKYSAVGLSGNEFSWGVMFPAGSYAGDVLKKVSVFDCGDMTGSVTIYNDGDTAPSNQIATQSVSLTGTNDFVEFDFNNQAIDNTKNVWVIFHFESGATYPAATCQDELDDPNGRWVEIGGTWKDLATAGVTGQAFMIRAEIGSTLDASTAKWTTVSKATSPYTITGLSPLTNYTVRVKAIYDKKETDWVMTKFKTMDANPVPSNIVADLTADGATLTWDGTGDSYNVQYRTVASEEVLFFEDFENGIPKTWTTIDADEDGNNWLAVSEVPTVYTYYTQSPGWSHNGYDAACSPSYANGAGSFDSDQWLITPQLSLQGTLRFYVASTYSDLDSYEVLLSTSGTAIADFTTTLQALTAASYDSWDEVNIDLSSYAGQQGYIAIRHKSSDKYFLVIDDFGLYGASTPAGEWQEMAVTDATATLSGLATNNAYEYQIQSVKGSETSEWSEVGEFALLTLQDAGTDNTSLIVNNYGRQAHVTLAGRTLYKDGEWNTLCLPFDIDDLDESPLADATVKTLWGATMTGTHVTLTFGDLDIYAGYPYIIKWDDEESIIENPQFANVTISATQGYTLSYSDDNVKFIGYFDAFGITAADEDIYYMTADSKLKHTGKDRTLNACRAYFQFSEEAAAAREFILDFGDETTTGTQSIDIVKTGNETDGTWYTVEGVTLDKQPTRKGLYINNGRKVVVK